MTDVLQSFLPTETIAPTDQAGVADAVRAAHDARQPVFPLGGRTSLDYGVTTNPTGRGLDLAGVAKIVDYTPRDMTIVVEAGVRVAELASTSAKERQHLPIDLPRAAEATIGGAVATNWSGPRRLGHGTLRDYVIGIRAVDGRGVTFNGGGRVVKNVAGYDFCKLLTGSLGTLGVITQLALKLKPLPEMAATVVADCIDLPIADKLLARLANLPAPLAASDLLVGTRWLPIPSLTGSGQGGDKVVTLVVRVEGTEAEVAALRENVQYELWTGGGADVRVLAPADADPLWTRQVEFADRGAGDEPDQAKLVLRIAVTPSAATAMIAQLLAVDPDCTLQAHAGNGIINARFAKFDAADLTRVLVGKLRPAAIQRGGSLTVVASRFDGLTRQIVWGGRLEATVLMERIKRQFDPHNVLNPGRFIV